MTDPRQGAPDPRLLAGVVRVTGGDPSAVEVVTQRPGRLVARVRHAPRQAGDDVVVKISERPSDFAAEGAANAVLRAAGVPVNQLLVEHTGPPGVLVARWVDGTALTAAHPPPVLAAVGALQRAVHAPAPRGTYSGNPTLVAWVDGWTRYALGWWADQPGVTDDEVGRARGWYDGVRPLVEGRTGATVLLDGRPEHLLVGRDHTVRLIDVGDLQAGDPVMDLAVLELHEPGILRGVLPTWGHPEVSVEHLTSLLPFYVFLRALAHAEWHGRAAGDAEAAGWGMARAQELLGARTRGAVGPGAQRCTGGAMLRPCRR